MITNFATFNFANSHTTQSKYCRCKSESTQ